MYIIKVDEGLCKGCGICIEFCPKKVYAPSDDINKKGVRPPNPKNIGECVGCKLCMLLCPDMALEVTEDDDDR